MSILQSRLKYNKAVSPSATCLGPFPVSAITDRVRGVLVAQQGLPIILKDGVRFAVLAPPNKDLRIVCAGCFTPGMSLFDDSKCKKISSFSQHWDTRKGDRKECCKALGYDSLENCIQRANAIKDDEVVVEVLPEDPEEIGVHGGVNELEQEKDLSKGIFIPSKKCKKVARDNFT